MAKLVEMESALEAVLIIGTAQDNMSAIKTGAKILAPWAALVVLTQSALPRTRLKPVNVHQDLQEYQLPEKAVSESLRYVAHQMYVLLVRFAMEASACQHVPFTLTVPGVNSATMESA